MGRRRNEEERGGKRKSNAKSETQENGKKKGRGKIFSQTFVLLR